MKTFERWFIATNRWMLIALLASMSLIIFANVALRYLTNASIEWAEEVARHMMIWLTFTGAGLVLRYGGHIAVENMQDAFPRPFAQFVRILVAVLMFAFFALMTWYGWLYMERAMFQMTAATQIPFGYIYAAIPIGGLMLGIHFMLILHGYVTERRFASDGHFDATASASL